MPHFAQNLVIFDHFLSSNDRNLQFCRFNRDFRAALRPLAGRVFETPAIRPSFTDFMYLMFMYIILCECKLLEISIVET
jgi:hypothetical protein